MAIKSLQCLRVMMLFMVSNLTLAFSSSLSSHPAASSPYQSNDNCQSNNNSELNRSKSNENHAESFNPHLAAPIGPHTVTLKPSVSVLAVLPLFCLCARVWFQICFRSRPPGSPRSQPVPASVMAVWAFVLRTVVAVSVSVASASSDLGHSTLHPCVLPIEQSP
jgi:hypothetical protein